MRRLFSAAELESDDVVLEVGSGTGGLTDLLAAHCRKVIGVEIDRQLCAILRERFRDQPNVVLIEGDVLADRHHLREEVDRALRELHEAKEPETSKRRTLDASRQGRAVEKSKEPATEPRRGISTATDKERMPSEPTEPRWRFSNHQITKSPNGQITRSAIDNRQPAIDNPVALVANLPYQVATPLLMNLLLDYPFVRRFCFTVQAEVGDRIVARPGGKEYGPLSIVCQLVAEIRPVARVPAEAFWPPPSVASLMLRMDRKPPPFATREDLLAFVDLARKTFDHRRKTLRRALGYVVDADALDRVCSIVDASRRPESFSIPEWLDIYWSATR
jgi:16S rRNA A1518/A1519 N6-dimethyltransferase RsmA/KsgA/DIM1 with predicted DNA glycosylase/AP lyase activity